METFLLTYTCNFIKMFYKIYQVRIFLGMKNDALLCLISSACHFTVTVNHFKAFIECDVVILSTLKIDESVCNKSLPKIFMKLRLSDE